MAKKDIPADQRAGIKYRIIIPTELKYTTQAMVNKVINYKDCVKGQMILTPYPENGFRRYGITFHKSDGNQLELIDVPSSMSMLIESISLRMRIEKSTQTDFNDADWKHREDEEINHFQRELDRLLREYESLEERLGSGPSRKNTVEVIQFNPDDTNELRRNNLLWLLDAFHNI